MEKTTEKTTLEPKGKLFPDFQPTLDRLNALLDGLKASPQKLNAVLDNVQQITAKIQQDGLEITIHIKPAQAPADPYPKP